MRTNGNMKNILLVLTISLLMAGTSLTTPILAVDDATARDEAGAREVTPSHIEIWSASSTLDPLIPFVDCVLADVVAASDGNTYVTGTFRDEIGFGETTLSNPNGFAMFVARLKPDGNWAWAVQTTGENVHGRGITLNQAEDKLYVVGNMANNNSFGGQSFGVPDTMMFVTEVGLSTGVFGSLSIPLKGNGSTAEAVIARPEGGVYVTGQYNDELSLPGVQSLSAPVGNYNAFVASLSNQGWEWITSTECYSPAAGDVCGNENATSLTLGYFGDLHVLGQMDAHTQFGLSISDPVKMNSGNIDVFVWSIAPNNGSSTGVLGTDGALYELPAAIITVEKELIVSGNFFGTMTLGDISVTSLSANFAGFVGSLTTAGGTPTWNWVRTVSGSGDSGPTSGRFTVIQIPTPWIVTDLALGPDGKILVGGEYWGPAQLDSFTLPGTGSNLEPDTFVAQLSIHGDWINVMSAGGSGPDGMTRVAAAPNFGIRVAFDSDATNVTFAGNTHYPSNRSVVVGSFEWDRDKDGVVDDSDNCVAIPNPQQENNDDDNDGDVCDLDDDDDGLNDTDDSCPLVDRGTPDADADGCPDSEPVSCEDECPIVDSDGDGVANGTDICPNTPQGSYVNSTGCRGDPPTQGCTNPDALNYDEDAEKDNGSCVYSQPVEGCTNPDADNYDPGAEKDDGSCVYSQTPTGNDTTTLEDFTDCDLASQEDCEEEAIVVGGVGVGLIGGGIIRNILRPGTGKGGGKPKLNLGKAKDAYDGAKFIADKAKGKKAKVGGSDHYLKPGVERQTAMSTAADTALDDYVED